MWYKINIETDDANPNVLFVELVNSATGEIVTVGKCMADKNALIKLVTFQLNKFL